MTIAELIKTLSQYPADADVCVSAPNANGHEDTLDVAEVKFTEGMTAEESGFDTDLPPFVTFKDQNADARMSASMHAPPRVARPAQQSRHYQEPGILIEQAALADKKARQEK
jgi:hypothetical protein